MNKIIYEHFIENPQNQELRPFKFAVINAHNELIFYVEQTDVLGTNYWLDTYTYNNSDIDDEIYFYFYTNLNSKEIPDQIWRWLKEPGYTPYLNGMQYDHANQLINNLQNGKDLIFPNQTLDSFKLLNETVRDLMLDDIKYIKPDYQEIISQLDFKIKNLQ